MKLKKSKRRPLYELIKITSPDVKTLEWRIISLPKDHQLNIPGAFCYQLSGEWGEMIFILIPGTNYDIWISFYEVMKTVTFYATGEIAMTECCFELKNNILREVRPFHPIYCEAGSFNLYHFPFVNSRTHFDMSDRVMTLDIHLKKSLLEKLRKAYPEKVNILIRAAHTGKAASVFSELQEITTEMNENLDRLLLQLHKEGAGADTRDLVYPLLYAALSGTVSGPLPPNSKTITDMAEICKLMEEAFPHRFNLAYLSQRACMSRSSFIRAFKKKTDITVRKYYHTLAMNTAYHLIVNTKLHISQIATNVGYGSKQAFSRAFHIYFQKRPSDLRKNDTLS